MFIDRSGQPACSALFGSWGATDREQEVLDLMVEGWSE
jgi:DNA-binding CsgD family transcriptional regulator